MKKLFLLPFIILLATSCSNMTDASNLVPDSADYVAVIDVKSLAEKAQLGENAKDMSSIKAFENELQNQETRLYRLYQDIKEDPLKAGVDLRDPIVIFNITENGVPVIGIAMDAWDAEDFGNTITTLLSTMETDFNEEKVDGFNYISSLQENSPFGIAYDDDRILMLYSTNSMLRQEVMDSLVKDLMVGNMKFKSDMNLFEDFMGERGDVSVFSGTDSYSEAIKSLGEMSTKYNDYLSEYMENNYSMVHLNFEDDRIEMLSKSVLNDKILNKIDQTGIKASTVDQKMLKYLPDNGMAVVGMSVETSGLLDAVREFIGNDSEMKKEFDKGMKEFNIESLMEAIEFNMAMVFIDISEKSVSSQYEYAGRNNPTLEYATVMKINDRNRVIKFIEDDSPETLPKAGDLYTMEEQFLSVGEESILLTSDRYLAQQHYNSKTMSTNLADSDNASKLGSNMFYMSMDLDLNKISFLKNNIPQEVRPIANMWDDFLVKMDVEQTNITENRTTLYVAETGKNSLARMIELAEESYKEITQIQ